MMPDNLKEGTPVRPARKIITIDDHQYFQRCIATDHREVDEIDRMIDVLEEDAFIDPYVSGTNNRRSDKELSRMLNLLDNLPISEAGKDGLA